jgi:hypothetical protein
MTQTTLSETATTGTTSWTIDASHSTAEFSAKHMMITTVKGRVADVRGTIAIDERDPARSSVEVELDAASIDTRSEQRDGHLRSADFLDVARFPTITFRSRRVEGARLEAGATFLVVGDLTIRDVRGARELQRRDEDRPPRVRPHVERGARDRRRAREQRRPHPARDAGDRRRLTAPSSAPAGAAGARPRPRVPSSNGRRGACPPV